MGGQYFQGTVYLSETIQNIDTNCGYYCSNFEVDEKNPYLMTNDGHTIYSKDGTTLIYSCGEPEEWLATCTTMAPYSFHVYSPQTVVIPDQITRIEDNAFYDMSSATVEISNSCVLGTQAEWGAPTITRR